jgi:hypothetical protein
VAILINFMFQTFGDMGLLSWYATLYVGLSVAVVGQLAVETGAWPGRQPAPAP